MSAFSFSFSGDDIEEPSAPEADYEHLVLAHHAAETGTLQRAENSAFPVTGQPLLPPQRHDLKEILDTLPSKIAYSTLCIPLDDGSEISIPRRELWDVRVQLMAEEDDEGLGNLGKDDVRTGIYEGGFKSWESSVDVAKVLYQRKDEVLGGSRKFLELGCGTALPSLAVFHWLLEKREHSSGPIHLGLADYNPGVLRLVTLPNLLLSWAKVRQKGLWEDEGELEIDLKLIEDFIASMQAVHIDVFFFSGAWNPEFVHLVVEAMSSSSGHLTIVGAETIYSPVALKSFGETLMGLLEAMPDNVRTSLVAAKKVYFGVGGSMEDFCDLVRAKGGLFEQIREESDGVRRAVVEVKIPAR
ncbi:related to MNI1 Putative S-adenosylmethionine-dependent methyltransferase of the seven beta-strand family [Phialocephala subalpina]|uniref:protein-histidine N-methyltransferase n=1 Tax=Phialocephala subalpina TaxID=576137 RepID=A0A1L7WMY0_9HELO|nr:related to MNI1 Putative S-adenosylmethionine-dependent methyltransferase of the seven beta-strand family [Phialocephala subalpina]